jgi:hypothetical protein
MGIREQQFITTNNTFQNIGSTPIHSPNALGNLSVQNPTVEQMNAGISDQLRPSDDVQDQSERLFGEHIREAAATIRRIFR